MFIKIFLQNYMHKNDKKVITLIVIWFFILIVPDKIRYIIFLNKSKYGMQKQLLKFFFDAAYVGTLISFIICFLIMFLYSDLLKKQFKKNLNDKSTLLIFFFISLISGIVYSYISVKFIENKNLDVLQNNKIRSYFSTFLVLFLTIFLFPFLEEIFFRRVLFQKLIKRNSLKSSVRDKNIFQIFKILSIMVVNSIFFSLCHFDLVYYKLFPISFVYYMLMGLIFNFCCDASRTMTGSMLIHMNFNGSLLFLQMLFV